MRPVEVDGRTSQVVGCQEATPLPPYPKGGSMDIWDGWKDDHQSLIADFR